jgi:YgiT-type zinc finger domain-containing protein
MYCGGELERGRVPYHIDSENVHIILDEVPAWVCSQCNEIQKLVVTAKQHANRLAHSA